MHLRTAHRWTTTHCGGHGAKNAHKINVAYAPLGNNKDVRGLGNRMKIVSPQCGSAGHNRRIGFLFHCGTALHPGPYSRLGHRTEIPRVIFPSVPESTSFPLKIERRIAGTLAAQGSPEAPWFRREYVRLTACLDVHRHRRGHGPFSRSRSAEDLRRGRGERTRNRRLKRLRCARGGSGLFLPRSFLAGEALWPKHSKRPREPRVRGTHRAER